MCCFDEKQNQETMPFPVNPAPKPRIATKELVSSVYQELIEKISKGRRTRSRVEDFLVRALWSARCSMEEKKFNHTVYKWTEDE